MYPTGYGKTLLETDFQEKYRDDDFTQQLCDAWGIEFDHIARWLQFSNVEDWNNIVNGTYLYDHEGILAQWFASTVTGQYIVWWENMLGIPTDITLTDQDRRNAIKARMSQRVSAPTPDYVLAQVSKFVIQASLTVYPTNYSFTIKIILPRAQPSLTVQQNIINAIEISRPAHLAYTLLFTEEDWYLLQNRDWATIGNVDWNSIAF